MVPTFEDIPYHTIVECIAKHLSEKEFGVLSMMSTYLRDIFMSNDVWKRLYIQTNLDKFKITDKSVHVGAGIERHKARVPCPELPLVHGYAHYWRDPWLNTWPFYSSMLRCGCISMAGHTSSISRDTVQRVRDNPIVGVGGGAAAEAVAVQQHFHAAARNYNRDHGCEHSRLCTNIDHYLIDTLDAPKSVRNYKDFRKQTLSKMRTRVKHDPVARKAASAAARKKRKLDDWKQQMRILKAEIAEEEAVVEKNMTLQTSLTTALNK
jgi:hypothetical protein